jgi:hypothetical protein
MAQRRDILKAASVLGGILLIGPIASARIAGGSGFRFIVDARLPLGPRLASHAGLNRYRIVDPGGEMIHLLLDNAGTLLAQGGHIIGMTGYADFALARDLLRASGRPIRHAFVLSGAGILSTEIRGNAREAKVLAELVQPAPPANRRQVTSFLWLA